MLDLERVNKKILGNLIKESNELTATFATAVKTSKNKSSKVNHKS